MMYMKQSFSSNQESSQFFQTLRARVNAHFESTKRSKFGNWNMKLKTVIMFLLYFTPYIILLTIPISHPLLFIGLWLIIGFGMAGIGLSVMHDANHGSYSNKKWLNKTLGYSMNLIGANAEIWKLQHNKLHHTYTNITGADDDINPPGFLRFSPYKKLYWIHKLQFIYVWFFYAISTLSWFTSKEFVQLYRYKRMGFIKSKNRFRNLFAQLISWKLFYFGYMLVLPIIFIQQPVWLIIIGFISMHMITGLILSMIFQTAHIMPECQFKLAEKNGTIENNWAVHEMMTTSNYAPKSKVFSWFIGGLNYQIEHHLFPSICHVHYKRISSIVRETAKEFNIPYHSNDNFLQALWNHTRMLYKLGRWQPAPVKAN